MTIITFITLAMQQALPLSDFAPLIQLWAGICLLFYYEKEILNESPLEKFQQRISDQFDNFTMKYVGEIQNSEILKGIMYIDMRWENFHRAIKSMAALCFLYSVIVLVYIGVENHLSNPIRMEALIWMDLFVGLVLLITVLWVNLRIAQSYLISSGIFVLLIVFFHLYPYFHNITHPWISAYLNPSQTFITVLTVFTCIGCVVPIILRLGLMYLRLEISSHKINSITKCFDTLVDWQLTGSLTDAKIRKEAFKIMNLEKKVFTDDEFNLKKERLTDKSPWLRA